WTSRRFNAILASCRLPSSKRGSPKPIVWIIVVSVVRMHCPRCHQVLTRVDIPPFTVWGCSRCAGCAATLATLRRGVQHDVLRRAWNRTIGENRRVLMECPECRSNMHRVPIIRGPEIDLCKQCQLVWFDASELEEMPRRSRQ